MPANPVIWFEIYVQDLDRAKKFYESVLQVKLEKLESPGIEMWAFPMDMNGPGASGALVKIDGVPSGGNSTLVYFSSPDCAVEAGRVVAAGGRIQREKNVDRPIRLHRTCVRYRRQPVRHSQQAVAV